MPTTHPAPPLSPQLSFGNGKQFCPEPEQHLLTLPMGTGVCHGQGSLIGAVAWSPSFGAHKLCVF